MLETTPNGENQSQTRHHRTRTRRPWRSLDTHREAIGPSLETFRAFLSVTSPRVTTAPTSTPNPCMSPIVGSRALHQRKQRTPACSEEGCPSSGHPTENQNASTWFTLPKHTMVLIMTLESAITLQRRRNSGLLHKFHCFVSTEVPSYPRTCTTARSIA